MDDESVVVDACCLINLFAASEIAEQLAAIGGEWHVPSAVIAETLFLHIKQLDGSTTKELVDLQSLIDDGVLAECTIVGHEELELYVNLATRLDDGESMALAIAKMRGWTLSTDDRKAKRLASELDVSVLSTPEIMKQWADVATPSHQEIQIALRRIENHASFFPSQRDSLYAWWRSFDDD